MRKLILMGLVALALGGCTTLQNLNTAVQLTTKSVTNPVTKNDLYQVESGMDIVFTALNSYKKACAQGTAEVHCRDNIAKVQQYTRQLPPLVAQLRSFVRTNDQINATVVYNQIVSLVANFKQAATAVGIKTGA